MKISKNQPQNSLMGIDNSARDKSMEQLKAKLRDVSDKASAIGSSSVKLSPEAKMFNKAKAIASDLSVNEAKVENLQRLIDEGKYKVDAEALAGKLMDEHLATEE